jgi:hypothetical protein
MANALDDVIIMGVKASVHEIVVVPDKPYWRNARRGFQGCSAMIWHALVLDTSEPETYTLGEKNELCPR